jgi:hypothetical protein
MPASQQQILIRELYQSVTAFLLDPSYRAYHINGLSRAKFQVEAMAQVMAQTAMRWCVERQAEVEAKIVAQTQKVIEDVTADAAASVERAVKNSGERLILAALANTPRRRRAGRPRKSKEG